MDGSRPANGRDPRPVRFYPAPSSLCTVALFIASLAFPGHPELLDEAKVGILSGSILAGVAGVLVLRLTAPLQGIARKESEPGVRSPDRDARASVERG